MYFVIHLITAGTVILIFNGDMSRDIISQRIAKNLEFIFSDVISKTDRKFGMLIDIRLILKLMEAIWMVMSVKSCGIR